MYVCMCICIYVVCLFIPTHHDTDPGNLEADLQVGAYTGYSLVSDDVTWLTQAGRQRGTYLPILHLSHTYIHTYIYIQIWVLCLATIMGLVLQCMSARLGIVTGKNLARVSKEERKERK